MRKLIYIFACLVAVSVVYFVLRPKPIVVNSQKVSRGAFELTVDEEGVAQVRDKYVLSAPITGLLHRVEVHSGQPVKAKQLLASVESEIRRNVVSPTDGYVLKVLLESEGFVNIGTPILEVANTTDLEVILDVLSTEAIKVQKGQNVYIDHWGGDAQLEGRVSYVEPSARTKISVLGVEEQRTNVRVALTSPKALWGNLGDGFRVEGRIVVKRLPDVLLVPLGAIFKTGESWSAFRIVNEVARKTALRIADKNSDFAVVESGLSEGDRVIAYPADLIEDGQSVVEATL